MALSFHACSCLVTSTLPFLLLFSLLISCGVILLGALGLQLNQLALLALHMAGYRVMKVDVSTQSGFRDAMQALLRQAGLEKKQVAAVFSVSCSFASSVSCVAPL